MVVRISKLLMVACLGFFALIVTFDNITDYDTNFQFVRHVLSMDTTFPGNALLYRSINQPALWSLSYILIIAAEGVCGVALTAGAAAMLRNLRASCSDFERAKRFAVAGVTIAFLIWFLGFMVMGGEWFAMWQSATWNGQQAAFRFYMTALAVLLFVNQADAELSPRSP
jgi:predicted small integral membrane protein